MEIEKYGIDPVPKEMQVVGAKDLFSIFMNFLFNPATIIKGGLAVSAGLSFKVACICETSGAILAILFYITMATVGVDYGIPGQVAARVAFGWRGAKVFCSFPRFVVSIYFFGLQTVVGSIAIKSVLDQITGYSLNPIAIAVPFAILQAAIALFGYDSLKWLSRIALPAKILILGSLIFFMSSKGGVYSIGNVWQYPAAPGVGWALAAVWINASAATWLSMSTDAADFCRYSKNRVHMWLGILVACLCGTSMASAFGAYGACVTMGKQVNTFTVIVDSHPNFLVLVAVIFVIILDNWTINVLNIYTGGLSINNITTKMTRFQSTLLASFCGVLLSSFPNFLNRYLGDINIIGSVFHQLQEFLHLIIFLLENLI